MMKGAARGGLQAWPCHRRAGGRSRTQELPRPEEGPSTERRERGAAPALSTGPGTIRPHPCPPPRDRHRPLQTGRLAGVAPSAKASGSSRGRRPLARVRGDSQHPPCIRSLGSPGRDLLPLSSRSHQVSSSLFHFLSHRNQWRASEAGGPSGAALALPPGQRPDCVKLSVSLSPGRHQDHRGPEGLRASSSPKTVPGSGHGDTTW